MRSHVIQTGVFPPGTPAFHVNESVHLLGKPGTFRVADCHRLECWFVYQLVEFPGFFVLEARLRAVEEE